MTRRRVAPLVALLVLLAIGLGASELGGDTGMPEVLGENVNKAGLDGEGVCDVDGIHTSYRTDNPGGGYVVTTVLVRDLSPTCDGADLTVTLTKAGEALSPASTVTVSAESAEVPIDPSPLASDVDGVAIELAGGTLPIPDECAKLKLRSVRIGTTGDDDLALGNQATISYSLGGDDAVSGGNQADCIDGGAGDDELHGGNQRDVLFGGEGEDVLYGGNQNDVLIGGPGVDVLDGGRGTDTCIGEATDLFIHCEKVQRP